MTRHKPMHINPGHPAWWLVPLAVACFLTLTTAAFVTLAVQGDPQAWAGAVIMAPVAGVWFHGYRRIRKEQR